MGYYKSPEDQAFFFKYLKLEIKNSLARYAPDQPFENHTNMTVEELEALADAFCFLGEDITIRKFIAWLFRFGFELNKLPGYERFWEKQKEARGK